MHSARRQNRDRVDILAREKLVDIVDGRNAEFRGDGVRARANGIADRDEAGAIDMTAAQQIGMALGDTPASEQAKSDHETSLLATIILFRKSMFRTTWRPTVDRAVYIRTRRCKSRHSWLGTIAALIIAGAMN